MKKLITKSVLPLLVALSLSISSFPLLVGAIDTVNSEVLSDNPALSPSEVTSEQALAEQNQTAVSEVPPDQDKDASTETEQFSQNIEIARQEQEETGYGEAGVRIKGASSTDRPYTLSQAKQDGTFSDLSAYETFAEAKSAMQQKANAAPNTITKNSYVVRYDSRVVAMIDGMVIALGNGSSTLSFNNTYGGRKPYVSLGTTMYYVDASSLNNIKARVSGVTGQTSYDKLMLVPAPFMTNYADASYRNNNVYERDYYTRNTSGDLVHTVTTLTKDPNKKTQYEPGEKTTTSSFSFDKAPSFMKADTRYYSMNGFDFYTDPFLKNKAGTFYSYYKYLSLHSESAYSVNELNAYLNKNMPSDSVLKNTGQDFVDAQNKSGINALLEVSFAIHESGRGVSSIARSKNNVFGINANDSNPSGDAYQFGTVSQCISEHAEIWLKQRYLDVLGDSRYFGANVGNKAAGVNVAYASDPYHGEKIAGWAYRIDKSLGGKDYNRYTMGLSKNPAPVYYDTNLSGVLYRMRNNQRNVDLAGLPVILLQKSANTTYQVQLDLPLSSNTSVHYQAPYSFNHVGYVQQSDIFVIKNNGFTNGVLQKRTSGITYEPDQQVKGATEQNNGDTPLSDPLPAGEDSSASTVMSTTTSSSPASATETEARSSDVASQVTSVEETPSSAPGPTISSAPSASSSVAEEPGSEGEEKLKGAFSDTPPADEDASVDQTLLAGNVSSTSSSERAVESVQAIREREGDFVQTSDSNTVAGLLFVGVLVLCSFAGMNVILVLRKRQSRQER